MRDKKNKNLRGLVMRQTRRHPRDVDGKAFIFRRKRPQKAQENTETALRNLDVRIRGTLGILDVLRYTWTENNESQNKTKLSAVLRKKIPFSVYEGKITGFCGIFSH